MDIKMKFVAIVTMCMLSIASAAEQSASAQYSRSQTETYSQNVLLKNWVLSVCFARISKDDQSRSDANATASAYMEFGRQQIEAYDSLRELVEKFTSRKYAGSVASEFNTMKCIDLFYSKELDALTSELTRRK